MAWKDRLQDASFRGVPFKFEGEGAAVGRRVETHEYPNRDKPYTEDLGKVIFRPNITAYVVGDDCFEQRDRLIEALNKPGPGTLVHPTYGELNVCVDGEIRVGTTSSEGRMVRFDLQFVEAGDGEALSLVTPVNGLPSGGMADTIAGGFDIEDLEVWRARVLERYYWTPQGGADGDYVVWAKEVPGVTRAWTYRHWMGTGTVGVMIASSDLINPILDDATVAATQAHIEPLAPVAGSDLYVFKATPKIIDFTIDLNPDNETTRAAVKAELLSFLLRDGYPEGTLELSRINEAISIAAGERSHTLISPAVDTPIAKNELAVMGDIIWA
ncbi:baseplate J/gp47 family protein [Citrobacter youngae]